MLSRVVWALPLCAAGLLALPSGAFAHAVCGDRIFPATIAIDDPGVGDELSIPTLAEQPPAPDGTREFDLGAFSWTKTLYGPNTAIVISDGATWLRPGGSGWDPLSTELQWGNFCWPESEFMFTVGFNVNWGGTGTGSQTQPFNTYQPVIDIGKGFGNLPTSLNALRPLALTFELSQTTPGQRWTDGNQNPFTLNGGFTIQYSLPYYSSHVAAIDSDFFKHLIPLVEFAFSTPFANYAPGTNETTGTIQPGVIYLGAKYQVAVEAILPLNRASGRGIGGVFSIDFYLDDIFPNSIGKPLFGASER